MSLTMVEIQNEQVRTAQFRQAVLGEEILNLTKYNPKDSARLFRDRSKLTIVPSRTLFEWWYAYGENGIDGLLPAWINLAETDWDAALKKRGMLSDLADAPLIDKYQVAELAKKLGQSHQTTRRWLTRYRVGGLWALAPGNDPTRPRKKQKPAVAVELGLLTEADFTEINRKLDLLGPEIEAKVRARVPIPKNLIEARAAETGLSGRTLRYYISNLRKFGETGLANRTRRDSGQRRNISQRMEDIIVGVRLSHKDMSAPNVYREAVKRALNLGETPPTEWVVRDIVQKIPGGVKALADGRESKYGSHYKFTGRMDIPLLVYASDIKDPLDVLAVDMRPPGERDATGETRVYKCIIMDLSSMVILAAKFSYLRPNETFVAGVIHDALRISDQGIGGVPKEMWVDNGKQLTSNYVRLVARRAGFELHAGKPRNPTERARLERFFEKADQELWSALGPEGGYVGRNVKERNPNVKAKYTIAELEQKFWEYVDEYHHTTHDALGMTPLEFWYEHCFPESLDPELADILLDRVSGHVINREGIKYDKQIYWHPDLGPHVGEPVIIRFKPGYGSPDEIEVFLVNGNDSNSDTGRWLCTAYNQNSTVGQSFTQADIRAGKAKQRSRYKEEIKHKRDYLADVDAEIEAKKQKPAESSPPSSSKGDDDPLLRFNKINI